MSICVIGSINIDLIHRVARLPRPGESLMADEGVRLGGGKGANQAIAAARLGARVEMIGAVGDDAEGAFMIERLLEANIDVDEVRIRREAPTGRAFIAVDDAGENMIFVSPGVNARVGYTGGGTEATVFLAQLEVPAAEIAALFLTPAARAGVTILNAAPASIEALDLMRLCDVVIVNQTELAFYIGADVITDFGGDVASAATALLRREGQTIVVTLGAQGAAAVTATGCERVPGRSVKTVDATGAGDSFCGALAVALDRGSTMAAALAFANQAAALSTQRLGAATAMPTAAEYAAAYEGDALAP